MISSSIDLAITKLQQEEVVAIPTETVYGLAGNAYSHKAIEKIFTIKQRPIYDPLIVHIGNRSMLFDLVDSSSFSIVDALIHAFWPGPLTLLLPRKNNNIPFLATAGLSTIAIRMPSHPVAQALLQQLSFPLVAPSANPFGYISPTQASHVADQLGDKISMILEGGACSIGVESTIIGFNKQRDPLIYRLGGISKESISTVIGKKIAIAPSPLILQAPGGLLKHYAPKTAFKVVHNRLEIATHLNNSTAIGGLFFQKAYPDKRLKQQIVLSKRANLEEAGRNLFSSMRYLDEQKLKLIIAEYLPQRGIGSAINDRLKRASYRN